jgi:hypothetical protein
MILVVAYPAQTDTDSENIKREIAKMVERLPADTEVVFVGTAQFFSTAARLAAQEHENGIPSFNVTPVPGDALLILKTHTATWWKEQRERLAAQK